MGKECKCVMEKIEGKVVVVVGSALLDGDCSDRREENACRCEE